MTNDELDALRVEILTEQERRRAIEEIPGQIAALTATYVAGGGDVKDLK